MQSGKIKRVCDYELGEHVREFDIDLGKVAAVLPHPANNSVAFVLVINKDNEYSLYKGLTDVKCGLKLARNIPESVAIQMSEVILGAEPPRPPKRPKSKVNGKKMPVPKPEPEPAPEPEAEPVDCMPYFDFV